jgi:hypothetical protein
LNTSKFRIGPLALDRGDGIWFILAVTSLACFVIGMALLGVSRLSGYFYMGSLVSGAPVLLRFDYQALAVPRIVLVQVFFLLGFSVLGAIHLLMGNAELSLLDYGSRLWIGLINGFFFLALFRFDRRALFRFIGIVAGLHAVIAVAVAIWQGVDFSSLEFTGKRSHGMTNPIPYSNMLLVSVGLAALVIASLMHVRRAAVDIAFVVAVVGVGTVAVVLTGTRGTLLAVPLLALLLMIGYRSRFSQRTILSTVIGFTIASVLAGLTVFTLWPEEFMQAIERAGSDTLRMRLLSLSWDIINDAPIFGHGLNSVPEVFAHLGLARTETSRLFQFNHMHNQYLDMLVKTGVVGSVLFFGPIVAAIVTSARLVSVPSERSLALAIFWVAGAFCIFGMTTSYFAHANTTLYLGVYLGMVAWLAPPPASGPAQDAAPRAEVAA